MSERGSEIRMVTSEEIPALKEVLDTIELFPSDLLDDMMSDYLHNSESEDIWFADTEGGKPISIGYCAPEKMTEGTYNLYAIGVINDIQAKGVGGKMMSFIENHLRDNGHRILIVDTSGTPEFKSSREFYTKLGYTKEAVIRDFWAEGDDKVVFCKQLN